MPTNNFQPGDILLETILDYKGVIKSVDRIIVDKVYAEHIMFRYLTGGYRTGELFYYRIDDPCRVYTKVED